MSILHPSRLVAAAILATSPLAGCPKAERHPPVDATMPAAHIFVKTSANSKVSCQMVFDQVAAQIKLLGLEEIEAPPNAKRLENEIVSVDLYYLEAINGVYGDISARIHRVDDPDLKQRIAGSFQGSISSRCFVAEEQGSEKVGDTTASSSTEELGHIAVNVIGGNRDCISMVIDAEERIGNMGASMVLDVPNYRADITADEGRVKGEIGASKTMPSSDMRDVKVTITSDDGILRHGAFDGVFKGRCVLED